MSGIAITFDDIKDLSYEDANVRLGTMVNEGVLSRHDGWELINQHIAYHAPSATIERLTAEAEGLRALLKALTEERNEETPCD